MARDDVREDERQSGRRRRASSRRARPASTSRGTPGGVVVPRPNYDPETFGRFAETVRPLHGDGDVPLLHDGVRHRLDHDQRRRDLGPRVGPLPVHPAQPDLLDPGVVRRPADPARAEPPGVARPGHRRAGPRGQRPRATPTWSILAREVASLRMAVGEVATRTSSGPSSGRCSPTSTSVRRARQPTDLMTMVRTRHGHGSAIEWPATA